MARNLLLILAFLMSSAIVFAQTSLSGTVTEEESGEPVLFGSVALYKGTDLITGTETDLDGKYRFANIDPGTYDVEFSYVGFSTSRITGVVVYKGKSNKLDSKMSTGIDLDVVLVTGYKVPLIEKDNTTQGGTLTAEQIDKMPTRDIKALAANVAGLSSVDEGDDITMKGSRSGNTVYFVDGIRFYGELPANTDVSQLQVITGGIGAEYGDVTGGIISITTKGPSSSFSGTLDMETSEYLDPYRNSLVGLSLSGPIWKKDGNTILGYRLSGRYTYKYDDDPNAIPVYQVTDEKLAELESNPVITYGSGVKIPQGDTLKSYDVKELNAQPNEEFERLDLTAKLDARLSNNIDITLSGTFGDETDRFTPNEASRTAANWRLMNSHNNPYEDKTDYRGVFRFRHRLGGSAAMSEGDNASKGVAPIQNASYTLQLAYEKNSTNRGDFRHGDNIFNYGYIGNFDYQWSDFFERDDKGTFDPTDDEAFHSDFRRDFLGYTSGTINPVLANYNNVSDITDENDLIARNGQISNLYDAVYEFHTNVGWIYNLSRKSATDIYSLNLNGGFDFYPGGNSDSQHSIQFGVSFEQRIGRKYDVSPRQIWQVAGQLANQHILGVDTSSIIQTNGSDSLRLVNLGGTDYLVPVYNKLLDLQTYANNSFFRKIRSALNVGLDEYVNVDGLSPDQMDLSYFSAQELNDRDLLDYYGYDYLGNDFDGEFNDFFTERDADGIRSFPVAPNRPIYTAAYIQDKFEFKDIIFRLGLRMDRFDANTKVLKDPYSLYDIMNASDFHNNFAGERPGNIGDDFKVYVSSADGTDVQAYRDEDQWYFANGSPANSGNLIFQGAPVNPKFVDERVRTNPNFIKSEDFDPNVSFKDYEVQTNFMPRLAFSFPISDEANFFAHYDVLVQRPSSNTIAKPLDYYYFYEITGTEVVNNSALKPERTVDYEVGFQQKLTNTSALKIAAYYKEMRDMIQRRTYAFFAPSITQYTTYDNQDFGTVKGFTFQYDLRRTGNIMANVGYTLQFADGTGSDVNSQAGLTNRGNLRTLYPLTFDERHRVTATVDYRYRSGNKYNGPVVMGRQILANTGVNLQTIAVSGRPYTKKQVPDLFTGDGTVGAINGARLPWNFTMNFRIDKDFNLAKPDSKPLNLNVYLRVQNLLNTKNIIAVYPSTGSAEDDGYLASARGVETIKNLEAENRDLIAYYNSYQWRLLNPNFYSLPRRIYIGAVFGF